MMILRALMGLFVLGGPPAFATWVGTSIRSPVGAFFAAWFLTPLLTCVGLALGWPLLRIMSSPDNDGTWVIMLPIMSVASGFVAGIVAAVIADKLRKNAQQTDPVSPVVESSAAPLNNE